MPSQAYADATRTDSIQTYAYRAFDTKRHDDTLTENCQILPIDAGSSEKYVKWGVSWQTPTLIMLYALSGIVLAISHHLYYQRLDGTLAGSSDRQQWSSRIGIGFSFLVIALFKAACDQAYTQLIWMLIKNDAYSLDSVDKLFSLTRDPVGLLSLELFKTAKLAILLSVICWFISLAGITPPSTLSVVPATYAETISMSWPAVDWSSKEFSNVLFSILGTGSFTHSPSSSFLQTARQAAQAMEVLPIPPPATNSSYIQTFYGPTVQCSSANEIQQGYFDYYAAAMGNSTTLVATQATFESGRLKMPAEPTRGDPFMLYFSAFTPYTVTYNNVLLFGETNNPGPALSAGAADKFNNWAAQFPPSNEPYEASPNPLAPGQMIYNQVVQKIFIQTSNQSLVCVLGNASITFQMEYVNGTQNLVYTKTEDFKPLLVPIASEELFDLSNGQAWNSSSSGYFIQLNSYVAYFLALSSVLNGNVTTSLMDNFAQTVSDTMTLYDYTSGILKNGLSACDDFVHGYWDDNAIALGGLRNNNITTRPIVSWREASSSGFYNSSDSYKGGYTVPQPGLLTSITNNLFQKPSWMCRNRTLARAIEDLANNITISMLSSPQLTTPNSTVLPVSLYTTRNIYEYDSRNLIISYSIAIVVTALAVCLGFYAFNYNGVAHSNSFTAVLATTGNPDFQNISRGHSLGALPMDKDILDMRVKFGVLRNVAEGGFGFAADLNDKEQVHRTGHIGFGPVETVGKMIKGGKYT